MSDYFDRNKNEIGDLFKQAHQRNDADDSRDALHHTLGSQIHQAAPGNHKHDDLYSPKKNTDWVNAIMGNNWVNYDVRTVQYKRLNNGLVVCRGLAKNGTVGAGIFTLDIGYRPELRNPNDHHFPVTSNGAFGTVFVDGNGIVTVGSGSNVWVDFASVQFMAAGF